VQSGTEKTNGNAGERLVQYLARNGGQARRGQLQRSRILRGSPESYDATLASLIAEGVIVCESAGKKTETIYKLAQPLEQAAIGSDKAGDNHEEKGGEGMEKSAKPVRLIKLVEQALEVSGQADAAGEPLDRHSLTKLLGFEDKDSDFAGGKVLITPAIAEILLRGNKHNRPLRRPHLNILVRAIKNGEWIMTGNGISFADDGQLIDGQHRLMAILEADQPVESMVYIGIAKEAFKTTDLGKKRGASDIAALMGFVQYVTVGCAATLLYLYENNSMKSGSYGVSNTAIQAVLQANRLGLEYSAMVARRTAEIVPSGIGAFCHFIFSRLDRDMADTFFDHLKTGADLPLKSPLLWLRNRLLVNKGSKAKLPRVTLSAFVVKTWNRYRKGQEAVTLNWLPRESFPKAI